MLLLEVEKERRYRGVGDLRAGFILQVSMEVFILFFQNAKQTNKQTRTQTAGAKKEKEAFFIEVLLSDEKAALCLPLRAQSRVRGHSRVLASTCSLLPLPAKAPVYAERVQALRGRRSPQTAQDTVTQRGDRLRMFLRQFLALHEKIGICSV